MNKSLPAEEIEVLASTSDSEEVSDEASKDKVGCLLHNCAWFYNTIFPSNPSIHPLYRDTMQEDHGAHLGPPHDQSEPVIPLSAMIVGSQVGPNDSFAESPVQDVCIGARPYI